MDVREKLVELLSEKCMETCKQRKGYVCSVEECRRGKERCCGFYADHLIMNGVTVQECARPLEEWSEDCGDVLWWKFPIEEPPYVGSPLDANWTAYHTHWTPIMIPQPPKGE